MVSKILHHIGHVFIGFNVFFLNRKLVAIVPQLHLNRFLHELVRNALVQLLQLLAVQAKDQALFFVCLGHPCSCNNRTTWNGYRGRGFGTASVGNVRCKYVSIPSVTCDVA